MWNLNYKDVNLKLEPMIVRVESADNLDKIIKRNKKEIHAMVRMIKYEYRKTYQRELQIGDRSLYTEILCHYYVQKITLRLQKLLGPNPFFRRVLRSTEVIDCGEKSCDTNRFVWDILSLNPYK